MTTDYGVELNQKIKRLEGDCNELRAKLAAKEEDLEDAKKERAEAREECGFCDNCSMCIG